MSRGVISAENEEAISVTKTTPHRILYWLRGLVLTLTWIAALIKAETEGLGEGHVHGPLG